MKKFFGVYQCIYIAQLVLNFICALSVLSYCHLAKIAIYLLGVFNIDIMKFYIALLLLIFLFACFIATCIYLILTIKQSQNNALKRSTKAGVAFIPLIFILLLSVSVIVPATTTTSQLISDDELCSSLKFEELQSQNIDVYNDYSYQENFLGKVVNLEQSAIIPDNTDTQNDIQFSCFYRKSNNPWFYNKFEKFDDSYFGLENKIEKDNYTFYYEASSGEYVCYIIKIEDESSYFVSKFMAYGVNGLPDDYSEQDFISDSLSNYKLWNEDRNKEPIPLCYRN